MCGYEPSDHRAGLALGVRDRLGLASRHLQPARAVPLEQTRGAHPFDRDVGSAMSHVEVGGVRQEGGRVAREEGGVVRHLREVGHLALGESEE